MHCDSNAGPRGRSPRQTALLARSSFFWAFGTVSGSTSTTATLSVRAQLGVVHIHTDRSLDRLASSNLTPTHAHANLSYACRLELSPSARRRTYVQRRIQWTTASGDSRAHGFAWKSGNDEKQQNSCSCSARVQYSPDDKKRKSLRPVIVRRNPRFALEKCRGGEDQEEEKAREVEAEQEIEVITDRIQQDEKEKGRKIITNKKNHPAPHHGRRHGALRRLLTPRPGPHRRPAPGATRCRRSSIRRRRTGCEAIGGVARRGEAVWRGEEKRSRHRMGRRRGGAQTGETERAKVRAEGCVETEDEALEERVWTPGNANCTLGLSYIIEFGPLTGLRPAVGKKMAGAISAEEKMKQLCTSSPSAGIREGFGTSLRHGRDSADANPVASTRSRARRGDGHGNPPCRTARTERENRSIRRSAVRPCDSR
uniref:Uncharacterized protein n=1 Tax=Oryza sativa subsp. japonica TaxID=39947 RepID=Q7F801_ORYSJ|nr:unnamed protein product [Oryza sativa Japonica Group]